MKRGGLLACIGVLCLALLAGCKTHRQIVDEHGWLDKEFTLRKVSPPLDDGRATFFHMDWPQDKFWGYKQIKILWGNTPDHLVVTAVNFANVEFILDEAKEMPTVRFAFNANWLKTEAHDTSAEQWAANIFTVSPSIPNVALDGVTIRLTREQYLDIMLGAASKKDEK